ncbi:MAG: cytochrome c maturation protein CcmE [Flavobacteriales bacterium]|nr:cytochrome c maturation protein CcmE [Flavobacteriales bacterium]MCX7650195.1 cytochrome c maturation protein CcmE [Flavobacteriales bacterium]MDW8432632.1 cytochrome c maturation protein CcmE [Flavobacteriales bacterium]
MKKLLLILVLALGLTGAIMYYSLAESSEYATFSKASQAPGREFHVAGTLRRDLEMQYDPRTNANVFIFYLKDSENQTFKVIYNGAKPQDFDNSEQVVVVGSVENDVFHARQILLKCPSKYNDGPQMKVAERRL